MRKDLSEKMLLEYPDVFADAGNVCLFHGEQVIRAESLQPLPQETIYKESDGRLREHRGDVRMRIKENGVELALLYVENQNGISNIMPLRDLGYTYSGYQKQFRDLKKENEKSNRFYGMEGVGRNQKLLPVISLVFYYGAEEWAAPVRLKEMLEIPEGEDGRWGSLIEDHRIHLVDLSCQNEEQVDQYRSDLWYIVKCLQCGKDREKYKKFIEEESRRRMKHPEAVIDTIMALAGKKKADKMAERAIQEQKEGDGCTMYTILDYLEEAGWEKGLEEGRQKGREETRENIYCRMFGKNKTPEEINDLTGESLEYLYGLQEKYLTMVREKGTYMTEKESL